MELHFVKGKGNKPASQVAFQDGRPVVGTESDEVCETRTMKNEFCTWSGLSFSLSLKWSVLKSFIVTLTK